MNRNRILLLLVAAAIATGCAQTAPPPPLVVPQGEDAYLVDPRTGYAASVPPAVETQFETAWRYALAGNEAEAQTRLADILRRQPDFAPASLAQAALAIRAGRLDEAREIVRRVGERDPTLLAARIYEAEIAFRQGRTRAAYELYREIAARPDAPPTARQRLESLQEAMFNETFAAALAAAPDESIRLLREALTFNPGAVEPRVLLARKLVEQRKFDEARRELEPLLDTAADRVDIQEMLAEIDVGRGRFQEAIVRYDRLARRTNEPRYEQRLEEIKRDWSAANMPPQFRRALESPALTRADFATLLYWTVPSVRFAQNLPTPPIAVDVADVDAREEVIRAIAMGLYEVDPVTRRVGPFRSVTAARLSNHLARVLILRGARCARNIAQDQVLAACSVADPLAAYPADATVTGRDAARALEQVAKALQ